MFFRRQNAFKIKKLLGKVLMQGVGIQVVLLYSFVRILCKMALFEGFTMKIHPWLIMVLIGIYGHTLSNFAMEAIQEELETKIIQALQRCSIGHARTRSHVKKTLSERHFKEHRKKRKLHINLRGTIAPACSPQALGNTPGFLEGGSLSAQGRQPFLLCQNCSYSCPSHEALIAHMFAAHQIFMCICQALFYDYQCYIMHSQACPIRQEGDSGLF